MSIAAGLLLAAAGVVVYLLSNDAYQECDVPIGARTGVFPGHTSTVNCGMANWTQVLGLIALICGALTATLGVILIVRDRVLPIDAQPS